jgi:hypothetical protein
MLWPEIVWAISAPQLLRRRSNDASLATIGIFSLGVEDLAIEEIRNRQTAARLDGSITVIKQDWFRAANRPQRGRSRPLGDIAGHRLRALYYKNCW